MPAPPLPLSFRPRPARAPAPARPRRRVFICDDDLEFARELADGLAANRFEARTLADGQSAIAIFEDFLPQIVLLDIYMPPPDGFEMLNHIQGHTRNKAVPVVLMSGAGNGILEVAARFCVARRIRLAAAFQKPLSLAEIVRVCGMVNIP